MMTKIDSDRAVKNDEDDQYDFVGIASSLAPAILDAVKGEGLVIGLEGQWGSGKTSLLNFVQKELGKDGNHDIHIISVTPWLNGDAANLVESVLNPISKILTNIEKEKKLPGELDLNGMKDRVIEIGTLLNNYTQKTARNLAPFASFAGTVIPGLGGVSTVLETGANALETLNKNETPVKLKEEISKRITELDVGFVIILDDLDRLEPEQAVEVVRLVRSVADFPNVAYLMCYDRDVLAQALKTRLKVKDGDLYLQKIVQLTFAIPLPEPFDLRTQFCWEAEKIYEDAVGGKLNDDLLADLKSAVDREGAGLTTPREVKLTLNGIRFIYPSIMDDVYFPDLCRLHLIKTTQFKLYKWLESYLGVRSILVTGDGQLSEDSRKKMGKRLKKLLPNDGIGSTKSIWNLARFVPGLEYNAKAKKCVFSHVASQEVQKSIRLKRLGSPLHYRYYFALTGPKTVMSDADFNNILSIARQDPTKLKENLITQAQSFRQSGKTWFAHILDRLDDDFIAQLDENTTKGFISAISNMMDVAMSSDKRQRAFEFSIGETAASVVKSLFLRLRALNRHTFEEVSKSVVKDGEAMNWLVGYFLRDQLVDHGKVGDRVLSTEQWVFSDEFLNELSEILSNRLSQNDVQDSLADMPKLSSLLYTWKKISGDEVVNTWVSDYSMNDEGFLTILNHLRHWRMSDKVYHPLSQKSIEEFFDFDDALERLDSLVGGEFDDKVKELREAIEQARN